MAFVARAPSPSEAAQAAADDLVELYGRLRSRFRPVSDGGVSSSQAAVLLRLGRDGASTTTVLALAEGVRSPSMTATLNSLAERGLVERHPDPDDGRRQIITLSDAGRDQLVVDRRERHARLAAEMDERFGPDQLRTIEQALRLLGELVQP